MKRNAASGLFTRSPCLAGKTKNLFDPLTAFLVNANQPAITQPFHKESGGAADTGVYIQSRRRTIFCTGAAFHAGVEIDQFGLFIFKSKYLMGTDFHAFAAACALGGAYFKCCHIT
jgi:hypothetical protein